MMEFHLNNKIKLDEEEVPRPTSERGLAFKANVEPIVDALIDAFSHGNIGDMSKE